MIPQEYQNNPDLLKWALYIEQIANGKSDEALYGEAASTNPDGSFDGNVMPEMILNRFIADGYVVHAQRGGWYKKS